MSKLGEWIIRELGKADRPSILLIWRDKDTGILSIRKVRPEKAMVVPVMDRYDRVSKVSMADGKKAVHSIPDETVEEITEELEIKGSLPYEVKEFISEIVLTESLKKPSQ